MLTKSLSSGKTLEKPNFKISHLDTAIRGLSGLLEENFGDPNIFQDSPLKSLDLRDEDIDNYIAVLSDRLIKIQESLTKEESILFKTQEDNIELKAKWGEVVKKQENTVKLGKTEIIQLSDQNKELFRSIQSELKQKELLLKENAKIDSLKEKINLELEKIQKCKIEDRQINEKDLQKELDLLHASLKQENVLKNNQEKNLDLIKKEITSIININEANEKRSYQIKEKMLKIEREKNCGDDKNNTFMADYKASIAKKNKLNKKLEELDLIYKKFEEEIILKNQQMELGRRKNQILEIKKIKYDTVESQISFEKEINMTLKLEKDMYTQHLDQILNNELKKPILNINNNNFPDYHDLSKKETNAENFIQELKKSQTNQINDYEKYIDLPLDKFDEYHKILEENIIMEDKLQELEIKLAEKNGVIDEITKDNKEIKYETEETSQRIQEFKNEKRKLLEKYSLLEKEMKDLGFKGKLSSKDV